MDEVELKEENLIRLADLKYGNVVHLAPPLTNTVFHFVTLKTVHFYCETSRAESYYEMIFEWKEGDITCTITILPNDLEEKVYFVTKS